MKRRGFLGCGALTGAATVAGAARLEAAPPDAARPSAVPAFALEEATVVELQARMSRGETSSRRIVELHLERIGAIDKQGPEIRSVIETNPDALVLAEALDAERRAKGPRGLLHGIPVLVKDNVDTADPRQAPSP